MALSLCLAGSPAVAPASSDQVSAEAPAEYELSWKSLHMGTFISGRVFAADPEKTRELAKLAESEIVRYESALSVHEDTPLARVNAQSGSFVEVDAETAELTRRALEIAEETESAFEPMIGPVVELWKIGFDGSRIPSDAEISAALKLVDHRHVQIERSPEAGWRMRIAPGQKIDLGGIAKGYVGEAITERLRRAGAVRAVLDLGGNIALLGSRPDGKPWRIGLQRPDRERGSYFAVVLAEDESVVTSGAYERNFTKNGKRYGHILSARTGRPVDTDLASVSIIDRDGARADALCTAFFAMGWERSSAFLKAHPDVKAVLLSKDLKRCAVSADPVSSMRWRWSSMRLSSGESSS